jgi:Flp pilus assembly protein TadB
VAIPVLLILAVLWAAVLVPPVLRSRSEHRRGGVGDYTSRLGALMDRRSASPSMRRSRGRPQPLRSIPPTSSSSTSRSAARSRRARAAAQKRRRNVLVVLIGVALLTFGLALVISPLLWILHVLADVLLVGYLALLFLATRHGAFGAGEDEFWTSTPDTRATAALAHPRVRARPELAPMHGASRSRRSAAG